MYSTVYLLIPNSQFLPLSPFSFGNLKFIFYIYEPIYGLWIS